MSKEKNLCFVYRSQNEQLKIINDLIMFFFFTWNKNEDSFAGYSELGC